MRFTTSQLRTVVVDPVGFVASSRMAPQSEQGPRNPQRQWMEAAWKAYFSAGRQPDVLWRTLSQKAIAQNDTPWRRATAAGAEPMLEQFLAWDEAEPDAVINNHL